MLLGELELCFTIQSQLPCLFKTQSFPITLGLFLWLLLQQPILEVFYAWARVKLQSVTGNALKEIFPRLYLFLLLMVLYFFDLSFRVFVVALVCGYFLRLLLMITLANRCYSICVRLHFPSNMRSILTYSITILMAGSAGSLIIDIDKFMIPQLEEIKQTAFYQLRFLQLPL